MLGSFPPCARRNGGRQVFENRDGLRKEPRRGRRSRKRKMPTSVCRSQRRKTPEGGSCTDPSPGEDKGQAEGEIPREENTTRATAPAPFNQRCPERTDCNKERILRAAAWTEKPEPSVIEPSRRKGEGSERSTDLGAGKTPEGESLKALFALTGEANRPAIIR
jgi:hypothetical protein